VATLESIGKKHLKNVARPTEVYRVIAAR